MGIKLKYENDDIIIKEQKTYPIRYELPEYTSISDNDKNFNANREKDDLFEDAAKLIVLQQQGSTSMLQRKMKLGYNRAGRIMDELENAGIVGMADGSKSRQVLIKSEEELIKLLKHIQND